MSKWPEVKPSPRLRAEGMLPSSSSASCIPMGVLYTSSLEQGTALVSPSRVFAPWTHCAPTTTSPRGGEHTEPANLPCRRGAGKSPLRQRLVKNNQRPFQAPGSSTVKRSWAEWVQTRGAAVHSQRGLSIPGAAPC